MNFYKLKNDITNNQYMHIYLFHRDLRIIDNLSLYNAIQSNESNPKIYPIFIFDPRQIESYNKFRSINCIQFMIECLLHLEKQCPLHYYYGITNIVIKDIITQSNDKEVYIYHMFDYTTFAQERHNDLVKLDKQFKSINIHVIQTHDVLLNENILDISTKTSNKKYEKFTPFYNRAKKLKVQRPKRIKIKWNKNKLKSKYNIDIGKKDNTYIIKSINIPINENILHHGGRDNGLKVLNKIPIKYGKTRNIPSIASSELSAYIKFGCISIREVYYKSIK